MCQKCTRHHSLSRTHAPGGVTYTLATSALLYTYIHIYIYIYIHIHTHPPRGSCVPALQRPFGVGVAMDALPDSQGSFAEYRAHLQTNEALLRCNVLLGLGLRWMRCCVAPTLHLAAKDLYTRLQYSAYVRQRALYNCTGISNISKEPSTSAKEPRLFANEPCIPQKSPVNPQTIPVHSNECTAR